MADVGHSRARCSTEPTDDGVVRIRLANHFGRPRVLDPDPGVRRVIEVRGRAEPVGLAGA